MTFNRKTFYGTGIADNKPVVIVIHSSMKRRTHSV